MFALTKILVVVQLVSKRIIAGLTAKLFVTPTRRETIYISIGIGSWNIARQSINGITHFIGVDIIVLLVIVSSCFVLKLGVKPQPFSTTWLASWQKLLYQVNFDG